MAGTVKRFEDLIVWQKARLLASSIYGFTSQGSLARDFELRSQMRSAVVSVASNIAEGFERGTDPQFAQFLNHARGSCGELRTQIYIAIDNHAAEELGARKLLEDAEEVSRMLRGLIRSIQS